jgi:hypothetical protein
MTTNATATQIAVGSGTVPATNSAGTAPAIGPIAGISSYGCVSRLFL